MKNFIRWAFVALLGAGAIEASCSLRLDVTLRGEIPGETPKEWHAVAFDILSNKDEARLEAMYADPVAMKYWFNGSAITGEAFVRDSNLLRERAAVRFGNGQPHGVLLVRNNEGECIGHAVIGQHFGYKGVGVPAFLLTPQAQQEGYLQAVAAAYFNKWVPEVVKRGYECFTGGKASDEWSGDGKLHYLMMLVHPDNTLETEIMVSHRFTSLTRWENKDIEVKDVPVDAVEGTTFVQLLSQYWVYHALTDNTFYNIVVGGSLRSVMKLPFGFRFGFWRDATLAVKE